jgi:hypothetical protein
MRDLIFSYCAKTTCDFVTRNNDWFWRTLHLRFMYNGCFIGSQRKHYFFNAQKKPCKKYRTFHLLHRLIYCLRTL